MDSSVQTLTQHQPQTTVSSNPTPRVVVERIVHFVEVNKTAFTRHITICYTYNRQTKTLTYGASIFRKPTECKQSFNRRAHNATARTRMTVRPVVIENFSDEGTVSEFNQRVRKLLMKHKVQSPRLRVQVPTA